ncbi:DpnD/PcfM family protein, partial [Phascolarctobacterium faecium]|uniref:DpnD/PcfM family protein n=3 Tax=Phascolarctobacterium faecium TaxID=33025 RepID=UPI003AF0B8A7
MEYSQFENMKNAINLYLECHKEENLDKDFYVVEIEEAYTTHVEILAKNEYEAEELIEEKYNQGLYFEDLRKEWVTNFFATKVREADVIVEARKNYNYNAIA